MNELLEDSFVKRKHIIIKMVIKWRENFSFNKANTNIFFRLELKRIETIQLSMSILLGIITLYNL